MPQDAVAALQQMQQTIDEQRQRIDSFAAALRRAEQAYEGQSSRLQATETSLAEAQAKLKAQEDKQEGRSLIHPSNVPKPPIYNGRKEDWEKFKHVFVAWTSTVHSSFPELLEKSRVSDKPLDDEMNTPEEDQLSKALYTFLIQYCPEPTMNVIGQGLQGTNGFEVWRRLCKLSEPSYRTKAWVWRRHLSNPQFTQDLTQWSTALHQWESELREFEREYKTPFSEQEKISILAHVAPKELQQTIFMHSDALDSYDKIRSYIEQFLINKNLWKRPQGSQFGLTKVANKVDDGGPMPMDIGAVQGKGKGIGKERGKGGKDGVSNSQQWQGKQQWQNWNKNEKGKDKGKGKVDKGKGKGKHDKDKGKGGKDNNKSGKGKGGNQGNPHAGKQCHVCGKHGHIAENCWWKVNAVEETQAATNEGKGSTGGSGSVGAVHEASWMNAGSSDDVIFTVGDSVVAAVQSKGRDKYLLIDSGACENVAKQGEFDADVDPTKAKPLFSVQGHPLRVYGKQYPQVQVGGMEGKMEMTVTDAAESLLSVHSLVDKGHEVHFTKDKCFVLTNSHERIPLEKHGKRWYLKVKQSDCTTAQASQPSQSRIAPVKAGERIETESELDTWHVETLEGDEYLVRSHNTPRFCLFAPSKMKSLPVDFNRIKPGRLTKLVYSDDGEMAEDESVWTHGKTARRNMGREWLGESWFKLKSVAEEKESEELAVGRDIARDEMVAEEVDMSEQLQDLDSTAQMERDARAPPPLHVEEGDEVGGGVQVIEMPAKPDAKIVEEHEMHHANFEPWCPACVAGQGRDHPHRRSKHEPKEHIIYSDYMFFTKKGESVKKADGEKQKGLITVLTGICKSSQYPFAVVVPHKGGGEYAVSAMVQWVKDLRWDKVVIQTDRENALNKLYDKVQEKLGVDKVTLRKSPRYSSQSLADGETINGILGGKIRTWLASLNEKYKSEITVEHMIFPWLVRHSAWTVARYHVNQTRTTPYHVIAGAEYHGEIVPFGETVMAKLPKVKEKQAPRWVKGTYCGKTTTSDEHLVMTEVGTQTYRTVRRLPQDSQHQDYILNVGRGVPWNTVLGIAKSRPETMKSVVDANVVPEVESQETYDFDRPLDDDSAIPVPIPMPTIAPPKAPRVPLTDPSKLASSSSRRSSMKVDEEGEEIKVEEAASKRLKTDAQVEGSTSAQRPGITGNAEGDARSADQDMDQAADHEAELGDVTMREQKSEDVISAVVDGESSSVKANMNGIPLRDVQRYKTWLKAHGDCFQTETVCNIMDYLDTLQADAAEINKARKEELRKLNMEFGAFRPRNRKELPREISIFGQRWVDKVAEGHVKARLTCQDFKRKGNEEDRNSSEAPSNFCPTPQGCSRKILEVYSLVRSMPRVKADLTSAFLIAKDQGDSKGQPVMMKPPEEWLEDYDTWLLSQTKEIQQELQDVPKHDIVWQVDGNIYGRQSAAAQYRDRLEEILTTCLPSSKYQFSRGKLDACVYRCAKTGVVLVHHIDDFDICGPEETLIDLLTVQLPANGCKLKMGEIEYPRRGNSMTSEFLGRKKINVENAIITKPNERHIQTILRQLGLENAKPSPVPGKKLDLKQDTLLNEKDKATYASCVGSGIYLAQDRPDIKFSVKELARRIREPRQCDYNNLKTLGRYLVGTKDCGHITKISEDLDTKKAIPLHSYCDSDWAGDVETRKSTSGSITFLAGTAIECSSHTQPGVPATSSGEAEIRSLTQCAKDTVFLKNLCELDFGLLVDTPRIWCDSSAALQGSRKMGVGKMRHVAVSHLYVQELVKTKQVIVGKVRGDKNPSDILTKHLSTGDQVRSGREMIGMVDLTQEGLDRHVTKASMRTVGSVNENADTDTRPKKWQPQQASLLSIRQLHSGLNRQRPRRVAPLQGESSAGYHRK